MFMDPSNIFSQEGVDRQGQLNASKEISWNSGRQESKTNDQLIIY